MTKVQCTWIIVCGPSEQESSCLYGYACRCFLCAAQGKAPEAGKRKKIVFAACICVLSLIESDLK